MDNCIFLKIYSDEVVRSLYKINNNKTIYDKTISNVEKFLSGKTKSIVKKIKKDIE